MSPRHRTLSIVLSLSIWAVCSAPVFAQPYSIGGLVKNISNFPVAGVDVTLYDASGVLLGSATTSGSGAYSFPGLSPGTYYVAAIPPAGVNYVAAIYPSHECMGAACDPTKGAPLIITSSNITGATFFLSPGRTISGTVTDASAAPMSGVLVEAHQADGEPAWSAATNGSGVYTIDRLRGETTYYVKTATLTGIVHEVYNNLLCLESCDVTKGVPISILNAGPNVTGINFSLAAGSTITGTVEDATTLINIGNVTINIVDSTGRLVAQGLSGPVFTPNYTVYDGLPPGTYYAYTSNTIGYVNEVYSTGLELVCFSTCSPLTGTPITVGQPSSLTGFNFQLAQGARISGTVRRASDNAPLPGVTVRIYRNITGALVSSAVTDGAGNYLSADGLPGGIYFVATENTLGYVDQVYASIGSFPCAGPCTGAAAQNGAPVTVSGTAITPNINFALAAGGAIQSRLTISSNSQPLVLATIELFGQSGQLIDTELTNYDGTVTFKGLSPGTYFLRSPAHGGLQSALYQNHLCMGTCLPTTGTPIDVMGASTVIANFTASGGMSIEGAITNAAGGAPLVGVTVAVYTPSGGLAATAVTDGAGSYAIRGLRSATYFVRTFNTAGFINKLHAGLDCPGTCTVTGGTPVDFSTTVNNTVFVNFALSAGGRISGVISNGFGHNLPNVRVDITNRTGQWSASGLTSVSGFYISEAGLPPGEYYATTANESGYVDQRFSGVSCGSDCLPGAGTPITITGASTVAGRSMTLSAGAWIQGDVRSSAGGFPVDGVVVQVTRDGQVVATAVTEPGGRYRFGTGFPEGRYIVRTANTRGLTDAASAEFTLPPVGTFVVPELIVVAAGIISGRITDAGTASPLPGVTVEFYDAGGALIGATVSTTDGSYRSAAGLPAGTYYARTRNPLGYVDERYGGAVCLVCNPAAGTGIPVSPPTITTSINFALDHGGGITGRVSSGLLSRIGGTTVGVYDALGRLVGATTADDFGRYAVVGLPSGSYYLKTANQRGYVDELYNNNACAGGTSCPITTGTPVTVTAPTLTTGIDFDLAVGGRISGRVTETGGTPPLAGALVEIFDAGGRLTTSAITDSIGYYVSPVALVAGQYYAVASAPRYGPERYTSGPCYGCVVTSGTPINVVTGATTPNINFALPRGSEVRGMITAAGSSTPLSNVEVRIYRSSGSALVASGRSDGSGEYQVREGLAPGSYVAVTRNGFGRIDELYADVPCPGDPVFCAGGTAITVPATPTVIPGIDFALAPGARISGRVADESGAGLAGISILVWDAAGRPLDGASTVSGVNGVFETRSGLPAGTYYISTRNTADFVDELFGGAICVHSACDVTRGTPIVISTGSVGDRDLALARGGRFSGRVTGRVGASPVEPLPGVTVQVANAAGLQVTSVTTDFAGNYQMQGALAPGAYYARTANGIGFADELFDNQPCVGCPFTSGTPVTVSVGSITGGVDFELQGGGLITGTIFDAGTGQPLANAPVSIFDKPGATYRLVARTYTNANGVYGASLPPGTYWVQADAFPNYKVNAYRAPAPGAQPDFAVPYEEDYCPRALCNFDAYSSVPVLPGDWKKRIDVGINACTGISVTPTTLVLGSAGTAVNTQFFGVGGVGPYGFTIINGQLPPGLTLDAATGVLSGTIAAAGSTGFTIAATDSLGCTGAIVLKPTVCGLQMSAFSASVPSSAGIGSFDVFGAAAPGCSTAFATASSASWLSAGPASGTAPATVTYSYQARGSFSLPRVGTITLAGSPFTVTQAGVPATFSLSPTSAAVAVTGGGGSISVISSTLDASWSASSDSVWATVSPAGGTGNGAVTFTVLRNATTQPRVATLTIAGNTFTITQPANGIPAAPVGLTATVNNFTATFAWQPAPTGGDATSWVFEAGLAPGTTLVSQNTTVPGYQVPEVPQGRYFIRVKGRNEFGTGPASEEYELIVGADGGELPGMPLNVTVSMSGSQLTMTWDLPAKGNPPTAYVLEAGTAVGLSNITVMTLGPNRTFTYSPVPNGFYFLRVRARNGSGTGPPSDDVLLNVGGVPQPPPPPQNLQATVSGSTVSLSWTAPAGGAAGGYVIEAGTARRLSNVATVNWPITSAVFNGVPRGVYFVRVRARNALGAGLASNEVMLVVP